MLCEDAVQIINSYTYTGNDSNKNELYSHYYDLLYDYLIKGKGIIVNIGANDLHDK